MYDVIIIGGGPAGMSAAVYAQRAGIKAVVFETSPLSGGQVLNTYEVDNYLGLPGVSGMELSEHFRTHAEKLGCTIKEATVLELKKIEGGFVVKTDEGEFRTYAVILATGATHAKLGVPGEEELTGMGVSYCATCDGAFFRDKVVAVIGGGDVAVEDAIYLSRTSKKVYLVHRRDKLRAAKMLQEQLKNQENIEIIWNSRVEKIIGDDQVESLSLVEVNSGDKFNLPVNGVFIAIGMNPVNHLVNGMASLDEKGFVMSGEQCITKEPGLFVAGDLRTKKLRQIVTAVADGANVINSLESYLGKVKG